MAVIKYKPTTNGRRNMSVPSFEEITKSTPEKSLVKTLKKNSGRNSYGRHYRSSSRQAETRKNTVLLISSVRQKALQLSSESNTILTVRHISRFSLMPRTARAI